MIRRGFTFSDTRRALGTLLALCFLPGGCSEPNVIEDNWSSVVIAGKVTRANAEPAAMARVRVDLRTPECTSGGFAFRSVTADAEGRYEVDFPTGARFDGCVQVRATIPDVEPVIVEKPDMSLSSGWPPADTAWIDVAIP